MNQDLRERVALLCQDRGYSAHKENGFVFVMDPKRNLKIYFMSPKKKQMMCEMTVVIKSEYLDGKWDEIHRQMFDFSIDSMKYSIDKLLDDIEEHFLLKSTKSKQQQNLRAEFEKIAQKYLFIDTLKTQNSDSLDFHDVSVWGVEAALKAAYELGRNSKK